MPLMRPWMENKLCLDISQTSFSQVGKDVQHSPQIETSILYNVHPCVRACVCNGCDVH